MLHKTHQFSNIWMNLSLNSSHHLMKESKYRWGCVDQESMLMKHPATLVEMS